MIATSDDLPKDFDVLGSIVVVAGALVVCLLGAAGAILLWRGRSMHAGLLCLLFLVPQIPDFAIRGLQYNFIVGGQVGPELALGRVEWVARKRTCFGVGFLEQPVRLLTVNFPPLVATIYFLYRLQKERGRWQTTKRAVQPSVQPDKARGSL